MHGSASRKPLLGRTSKSRTSNLTGSPSDKECWLRISSLLCCKGSLRAAGYLKGTLIMEHNSSCQGRRMQDCAVRQRSRCSMKFPSIYRDKDNHTKFWCKGMVGLYSAGLPHNIGRHRAKRQLGKPTHRISTQIRLMPVSIIANRRRGTSHSGILANFNRANRRKQIQMRNCNRRSWGTILVRTVEAPSLNSSSA